MTGRELITYILENKLEDKEIFKNGKLLGCMSIEEAALKFGVGVATIELLVNIQAIPSIQIGESIYIPSNAKYPTDMYPHVTKITNGAYHIGNDNTN